MTQMSNYALQSFYRARKRIIIDKSPLLFSFHNVEISDNYEPYARATISDYMQNIVTPRKAYFCYITIFCSKRKVTTKVNNLYTNTSHSVI